LGKPGRFVSEATKLKISQAMKGRQHERYYQEKVYCKRCREYYPKQEIEKYTRLSRNKLYILCKDCGTRIRQNTRGRSAHNRLRNVKRID
jgi:RNase P subunit RPR2